MSNENFYMGRNGFYWFHGVVEDRMDPEKVGKVRVRILGCHTKDKVLVPTDQLYWANVLMPITSASVNGIGESPLGVVPGTWVFGFFRDGETCQDACIMGTVPGVPYETLDPTQGFSDPRDNTDLVETLAGAPRQIALRSYSKDGTGAHLINGTTGPNYPQTDLLKESDVNRIARNEKTENTILQVVKGIRDAEVPIAYGGTWAEPQLFYSGTYPFVHVFQSESGHTKIIDDTPNSEGQLDIDRSGTFKENLTDGSEVHKIVGDGFTIVMKDHNIHIMNNQNECVNKDYNLLVGGAWNVEVVGNINIKADYGGAYIVVQGDANIKARGNVNVEACQDVNVMASRNASISAGGNSTVQSLKSLNLISGETINMHAPKINLSGFVSLSPLIDATQGTIPVHAKEPKT